jgi:hypothetical protein
MKDIAEYDYHTWSSLFDEIKESSHPFHYLWHVIDLEVRVSYD